MNNEPVAWMLTDRVVSSVPIKGAIPLYTHPAKTLNAGGEPVKNATYWKRQYNEMFALNDRLKSSLYHANEQIKYLESHPAKTLTDEEIIGAIAKGWCSEKNSSKTMDSDLAMAIANEIRAILRKAKRNE